MNMVDVEINKVQEIKDYLLKSPTHFGGAKFTRMMRDLSNEEKPIATASNRDSETHAVRPKAVA